MQRALQLAAMGKHDVYTNPMVGCVIVKDENIIAESYHKKYGEAHAEVNTINLIADKNIITQCDVYITLEPCSHTGKTPPCVDLLIKYKPKHVFIACLDPNPIVVGNGIKKLADNNICYTLGICEQKAKQLNTSFFINQIQKRCSISIKWAQSEDGYIAAIDENEKIISTQISNELTNQYFHSIRNNFDAILIGKNTLIIDNPSLTIRHVNTNKKITRILICNTIDFDTSKYLFFNADSNVIVFNKIKSETQHHIKYITYVDLNDIAKKLLLLGIGNVLIEGGASTHQSFIDENLVDEFFIIKSDKKLNAGLLAPSFKVNNSYESNTLTIGSDVISNFKKII